MEPLFLKNRPTTPSVESRSCDVCEPAHSFWRAPPKSFRSSVLQPVARPEHPDDGNEAGGQKRQRHPEADAHAHVSEPEEAPAEAADQIEHGVEQGDGSPDRG